MEIDKKITHQNLHDEIVYNIKKQDNYTATAYTITISIWTIALGMSNEWIALIPLVILLPITLLVCDCRYSIAFISSYMAVFLEEESTAGWEYMREVYYSENRRSSTDKMIYLYSKFGFWVLNAVSVVIFWAIRGLNFKIFDNIWFGHALFAIQVLLIIFHIVICNLL